MTQPVGRVVRQLREMLDGETAAGLRDAQLLERFTRDREEQAFAALVHRHGPLVLGVCQRILQHRHDAEDAFQATFLVLARRAAAIRQPDSLAAWLHGIALRVARTMKRDAGKRRQLQQHAAPPVPQGPPDPCLRELQAVLDEELQRLPENHRQPLLLCYFQGLTQEEAARQLGWPRGTLKRRLERGRELLKVRLIRRGLSLGAALIAATAADPALAVPLPPTLGVATSEAAVSFAARKTAPAAGVSAHVMTLAEGVLRTMFATRVILLSALVLVFGLGAIGALVCARAAQSPAEPPANAGSPPDPVPSEPEGPKAAANTQKRFEEMAAQLPMFPTTDFAYGRGDRTDSGMFRFVPRELTDPWRKAYAALSAGNDDVANLAGLLKHKDPKVRTLALAALFERQDPKLLPHLATLLGDTEKTFPEVAIRRALTTVGPNPGTL